MNQKLVIIIILVISITCHSCIMSKTVGVQPHIANLKEKGDVSMNGSVSYGSGNEGEGLVYNGNFAYALNKRSGIYLSGSKIHEEKKKTNYNKKNIWAAELGYGLFKKKSEIENTEMIFGLGYGKTEIDYFSTYNSRAFDYGLRRRYIFAQYNKIYEKNKFYGGVTAKTLVNYYDNIYLNGKATRRDTIVINNFKQKPIHVALNLGIELGLNWKHTKLYFTLQYYQNVFPFSIFSSTGDSPQDNHFGYMKYYQGLGFRFNFNS